MPHHRQLCQPTLPLLLQGRRHQLPRICHQGSSATFQLNFRISRFGVSHGSLVTTGANAQTANVYNLNSWQSQSTSSRFAILRLLRREDEVDPLEVRSCVIGVPSISQVFDRSTGRKMLPQRCELFDRCLSHFVFVIRTTPHENRSPFSNRLFVVSWVPFQRRSVKLELQSLLP